LTGFSDAWQVSRVPAFWEINSFPDFCGVAGFFVAVVGLLATWNEARKARTAAEAAAEAAEQVRDDLNRFDIIKTLSETAAGIEEVKTLQRYGVWELLPAVRTVTISQRV
jgi:hypothetical protein